MRLSLRIGVLIGNIQICILPYVLQRSLIVNFHTYLLPHTPTYASKIKTVMKRWSKRISMVIAKTAIVDSRGVIFKTAVKIAESALAGQSEALTREVARVDIF